MNIAILSGKGGTGKTFIAVNLAAIAPNAVYADCDVEEPNGHLFFNPTNTCVEKVTLSIPCVLEERCTACRACVDFCKYNALACINGAIHVFEDICHACGGCALVCPEKAIVEKEKTIGTISLGTSFSVSVVTGMLNTGEVSGVPIIASLLKHARELESKQTTIIDCPPGSACVVMESIRDADYCVLVAEPTVFGAQNLQMVWELVQLFGKPHGVVLNKFLPDEEDPSEAFCREKNITIIGRIPFSSIISDVTTNGRIAAWEDPECKNIFTTLLGTIQTPRGAL